MKYLLLNAFCFIEEEIMTLFFSNIFISLHLIPFKLWRVMLLVTNTSINVLYCHAISCTFFPSFGPSPVFTNSERTCDKDFIIRRAATNRVLNVLRHWVSKHSQVRLHPLLPLVMCGSSMFAGWSSLSALLLEQAHCRMHTNSHWTPLACQLDNQSQYTYSSPNSEPSRYPTEGHCNCLTPCSEV